MHQVYATWQGAQSLLCLRLGLHCHELCSFTSTLQEHSLGEGERIGIGLVMTPPSPEAARH